uniref:N-alpha-acetyltransferase 60 n=1 Tax=Caenorhabditis tropicalis TaxID=1561998 RepID=A0A1I7SYW8_9PELO
MTADGLTLRRLQPWDRLAVETLCNESFPIQYPECWYEEVVAGGLRSTGLFEGEQLAAMIVSETKFLYDCNLENVPNGSKTSSIVLECPGPPEVLERLPPTLISLFQDQGIISESNVHVTYILSIAVDKKYRRHGLATRLLNHLMTSLIDQPPFPRVVFLHVLSTNSPALSFYKRHGFEFHASLPEYYRIGEVYADGCTYVKYINSSHAPATFSDDLNEAQHIEAELNALDWLLSPSGLKS